MLLMSTTSLSATELYVLTDSASELRLMVDYCCFLDNVPSHIDLILSKLEQIGLDQGIIGKWYLTVGRCKSGV